MEGELGSGARIAIALIVIGVIISVIFVILGFTRGTTNSGITTVQNSMDSMSLAQFDDYDQKTLSGTQVISAIKLFEGRPIASVVRTVATTGATTANPNGNGMGQNYGAILTSTSSSTPDPNAGIIYTTTTALTKIQTTDSFYTRDINTTSGVVSNMNYRPLSRSASNYYVRPTAKFMAELIHDKTGTIVGVCFTQLP